MIIISKETIVYSLLTLSFFISQFIPFSLGVTIPVFFSMLFYYIIGYKSIIYYFGLSFLMFIFQIPYFIGITQSFYNIYLTFGSYNYFVILLFTMIFIINPIFDLFVSRKIIKKLGLNKRLIGVY